MVKNGKMTLLLTSEVVTRMAISHTDIFQNDILVIKNGNFTSLLTSSGQFHTEWQFHIATDI